MRITLRELTVEIMREQTRRDRQRAFIASKGATIRSDENPDAATMRIRSAHSSLPDLMPELAACAELLKRIG